MIELLPQPRSFHLHSQLYYFFFQRHESVADVNDITCGLKTPPSFPLPKSQTNHSDMLYRSRTPDSATRPLLQRGQ